MGGARLSERGGALQPVLDQAFSSSRGLSAISYDEGDIELRHDRGRVDLRGLDDMEGFLRQLIELNPALELPPGWREDLDQRANKKER